MKPPALADWLFTKLAPRHLRNDVLGDLHEEFRRFTLVESRWFRARLWYWRQVFGTNGTSLSPAQPAAARFPDRWAPALAKADRFPEPRHPHSRSTGQG